MITAENNSPTPPTEANKNVLFALSPFNCFDQFKRYSRGGILYNYQEGIALISSYIKQEGFNPHFFDGTLLSTKENYANDLCDYIKSKNITIVGFPCYTVDYLELVELSTEIKQLIPNIIIAIGNVHATNYPRDILETAQDIDYIILGEGEISFLRLCQYLNGQGNIEDVPGLAWRSNGEIHINNNTERLNITSAPLPAYEIFPMRDYVLQPTLVKKYPTYTLFASRGCAFHCAFCDVKTMMGRRVRYRPVERVIENMRHLTDNFGAQGFAFQDSTFTTNKRWVMEFCDKYKKSKINKPWLAYSRVDTITKELIYEMKDAGCWCLSYGIESGNQKTLDLLEKRTTIEQNLQAAKWTLEAGIMLQASYIICLPGEDENDAHTTYRFAKEVGAHIARFFLPTPYPKTKLYEICKNDYPAVPEPHDSLAFDFLNYGKNYLPYINPRIGKEKMIDLAQKFERNYYLQPKILFRNLTQLKSHDDLKKYWTAFKAVYL